MAFNRMDKLLAATGKWSRKEAKALVKQGRVTVNGSVINAADYQCDGKESIVYVDGEQIEVGGYHYVMLYKPSGVLSATEDAKDVTALDLLPGEMHRIGLFPVGRLDKDAEGLLLMTDDGQLAHRLTSPKYHVEKIYFVCVEGCLTEDDCIAFERGIVLGDGTVCRSAGLRILDGDNGREGLVTLREGKYHQIKRMMASRGKPVRYLKRLSIGPLSLDEHLEKGGWRWLNEEEKTALHIR